MIQTQICPSCKTEAPLSAYLCSSCKSVLFYRIPDLNLWELIKGLFWTPEETLITILRSERKNLLPVFLFFIAFKLYILGLMVAGQTGYGKPITFGTLIIGVVANSGIIALIASVTRFRNLKSMVAEKKFKNHFALMVYSFIPLAVSLPLLQIPEYAFYGEYIFVKVPSPFMINAGFAYVFSFFELLFIGYSAFLVYTSLKLLSGSKLQASLLPALIFILFFAVQFVLLKLM